VTASITDIVEGTVSDGIVVKLLWAEVTWFTAGGLVHMMNPNKKKTIPARKNILKVRFIT
jgi:hypothetical protein